MVLRVRTGPSVFVCTGGGTQSEQNSSTDWQLYVLPCSDWVSQGLFSPFWSIPILADESDLEVVVQNVPEATSVHGTYGTNTTIVYQ